jgi:hypothetical protein
MWSPGDRVPVLLGVAGAIAAAAAIIWLRFLDKRLTHASFLPKIIQDQCMPAFYPSPRPACGTWRTISADTLSQMQFMAGRKSTGVAYLPWFLIGTFGVHRIYLRMYSGRVMAIAAICVFALMFMALQDGEQAGMGVYALLILGINGFTCLFDRFRIPFFCCRANEKLVATIAAGRL